MENKVNTAGYYITGTSVEKEERVKSDKLLLNTIESERIERMESHNETIDELAKLSMNDIVILKELRKHEIALNFVIGLSVGLLLSMILIAL